TSGAPNAPSGTDAKPATSSTVDVAWTDKSSNESGFRVERSTDGGSNFGTVATTGPNATSFTDTGRNSEYLVCYRIVAFNALGDSPPSNTDCTTPPRGPSNLTAGRTSQQTILVAWQNNSTYAEAFEVQRSTAASGPFV